MGNIKENLQFEEPEYAEIYEDVELQTLISDSQGLDSLESILESNLNITDLYLKDIKSYKLLTFEEEQELFKQIEKGKEANNRLRKKAHFGDDELIERSNEAINTIITSNLRLVVYVALRYSWTGVPLDDLIQEGNIGLIKSIDRFKYQLGYKFSTYATYWIRQSILRYISDKRNIIHLPVYINDMFLKISKVEYELEKKLGRKPYLEEVAEELQLKTEILKKVLNAQSLRSLDEPFNNFGDELTLGEILSDADDSHRDREVFGYKIVGCIQGLIYKIAGGNSDKERKRNSEIIMYKWGMLDDKDHTLESLARKYGLTRERIRQIVDKSTLRLIAHINRDPDLVNLFKDK